MNMHSEIYKHIRDNIIKTWPAWKRKIYNSCFAISAHAEKLPEDDRTRSTPVWTNYDHLISKTPEELAELLNKSCPPKTTANTCRRMFDKETGKYNCVRCWIEWLKAPADKENKDE